MVHLKLDGRSIEVPPGTTLLEAAARAGVEIPTLCHHPGIEPPVSCFLCVVAVEGRERLLPACATRAEEGMSVVTGSPEVLEARRRALELLLSDHAGECSAPCRLACPAGLDISFMLWLLARGRREEAARVAEEQLLLPGTLGAICPAFCQKACRRGELDQAIAIAGTHRRLGEAPGPPGALPPAEGPAVAVVGAGPAGLAAAAVLRRAGRAVVLFESGPETGGGLLHSMERGTLPAALLEAECARLLQGVELRRGSPLGPEPALERLLQEHPAVVVATGSSAALGSYAPDRKTGGTDRPGLFAAGESLAAMGRAAVRAVASGRRSAETVLRFLAGEAPAAPVRQAQVRYRELDAEERALLLKPPAAIPGEGPLAPEEREAARCLGCGCAKEHTCRLRRQASAHAARSDRFAGARRKAARDESHARVGFDSGKCILCGICVGLAAARGAGNGMVFHGRGFPTRVGPPFAGPLAASLGPAALEAAAACPTGALYFKEGLEADRRADQAPQIDRNL